MRTHHLFRQVHKLLLTSSSMDDCCTSTSNHTVLQSWRIAEGTRPIKAARRTHRDFSPSSRLHVVLALLLIEFSFFLCCCVLVLLVLRDKVVHVTLGLGELHLVHPFSRVPMQKGFPAEHGSEIFGNALEHFLDRRRISREGHRHLQTFRRDVANGGLDVVRNPLDEVGGVLILHVEHLFVHLLRGHPTTEKRRSR